ncbi:bZIP transcription factor [Enterobacter kobei]|uniref:bZIP transcription factor n=1 Tax=Enterobacter kobei TaxID=208224 RepID=UPI0018D6BC86|nr:bZIP transcription factor [Enterobacter kobei]
MSNREQFEAWLVSEYEWANDTLNCANFIGDDETGHYIGGDYIYDGGSCGEPLFWAWRGWQANHKSLTESDRYGRQADITIENLERKVEQLAAENSSIKAMNDCLSEELRGYESDGAFDGPKMHLLWWKVETPATDAFLAEVGASGLEMAANMLNRNHPLMSEAADAIISHAAQLRQEAK